MDEVIVDTTKGFIERWKEMFPGIPYVPYEKMSTLCLENLYSPEHKGKVSQVWTSQGLFYDLKPLPGALKAIEEIRRKVGDVAICTSLPHKSRSAAQEKYEWVRDNLDNDWLKRLIIIRDKTRVKGDILIDDKPRIIGVQNPSWEHILYTHPWNIEVANLRRLTWDTWREVLTELE
jgi:5'-nucleotidase